MPGPAEISRGNLNNENILNINIAAGTVATNTVTLVTVSVPGLLPGDCCTLQPRVDLWPASQPALNLPADWAYCSAVNVLTVAFSNNVGAASTQTTSVPYTLNVARSGNYSPNTPLPSALV